MAAWSASSVLQEAVAKMESDVGEIHLQGEKEREGWRRLHEPSLGDL